MRFVLCNACVGAGVVKKLGKELICDGCGGAGKINKARGVDVHQQQAHPDTIEHVFSSAQDVVITSNSMPSIATQTQRQYSAQSNTMFGPTYTDRFVPQARNYSEYERAQDMYMKSLAELKPSSVESGGITHGGGLGVGDLTRDARLEGTINRQTDESRKAARNYQHLMNNVNRENHAAQLMLSK